VSAENLSTSQGIPMSRRAIRNLRFCVHLLRVSLILCLGLWVLLAPLIWILRDGLGPDAVETVWPQSAYKFLVGWGGPALALAVPLLGLMLFERRMAPQGDSHPGEQS
jgi:hypothetical protein